MILIGRDILDDFKEGHADVRSHIDAWVAEVKIASWQTPLDLKQRYPKASILPKNQVVFDLNRNRYRLLVKVEYRNEIVMVKKVGTHKEYMKW